MAKKKTNEEWLDDCLRVHGDKYDYSQTDFCNRDEKGRVNIICHCKDENGDEHGVFSQNLLNHIHLKHGCPKCNGGVNGNKEDFIRKSKQIFKDENYGYDKVVYVNNRTNVILTCPEHGDFEVTPSNHLNPNLLTACPYCSGDKVDIKSIEEIAKKRVGDTFYKYCGYTYEKHKHHLHFNCPIDGEIVIRSDHLLTKKNGICEKCNIRQTRQQKEMERAIYLEENKRRVLDRCDFIWASKQLYGNKFDYSKVSYVDINTPVTLICPQHGEFQVFPNYHLQKVSGCPICKNGRPTSYSSTEEWLKYNVEEELLKEYDFSKFEYNGRHTHSILICPEHGEFEITPGQIASGGFNCPQCKKSWLEKTVHKALIKNNIKNEYEKTFDWLKYKKLMSLDFYLEDYNIAIECQGRFHFENTSENDDKGFLDIQKRDKIKKELCLSNNVKLIYFLPSIFAHHMQTDDIFFTDINEMIQYILVNFPRKEDF